MGEGGGVWGNEPGVVGREMGMSIAGRMWALRVEREVGGGCSGTVTAVSLEERVILSG